MPITLIDQALPSLVVQDTRLCYRDAFGQRLLFCLILKNISA